MNIKSYFKKLSLGSAYKELFVRLFRRFFYRELRFSYSTNGEDIIIANFLSDINEGFFIDVGCNEPIAYSNTFGLYLKGWKGINIDANKVLIDKYKTLRSEDININAAVSDTIQEVEFHISSNHTVSTISKETLNVWNKHWEFTETQRMKTQTLDNIIEDYVPENQKIHLLSVDVEGHDFNVLKSINLNKYRPYLIVIELFNLQLKEVAKHEIVDYLQSNNYDLVAYATNNAYFWDNNIAKKRFSAAD